MKTFKQFFLVSGFLIGLLWPFMEGGFLLTRGWEWVERQIVEYQNPPKIIHEVYSRDSNGDVIATWTCVSPGTASGEIRYQYGDVIDCTSSTGITISNSSEEDTYSWQVTGTATVPNNDFNIPNGTAITGGILSDNTAESRPIGNLYKEKDMSTVSVDGWPNAEDCPFDKVKNANVCK